MSAIWTWLKGAALVAAQILYAGFYFTVLWPVKLGLAGGLIYAWDLASQGRYLRALWTGLVGLVLFVAVVGSCAYGYAIVIHAAARLLRISN